MQVPNRRWGLCQLFSITTKNQVRLDGAVLVKHDGQVFVWEEEELYQPFGSLTRFFGAKAEIGLRISLGRDPSENNATWCC